MLLERRELMEVASIDQTPTLQETTFFYEGCHLEITCVHSIVIHKGLDKNLKGIVLNAHVQAFLDLLSQNLQGTA